MITLNAYICEIINNINIENVSYDSYINLSQYLKSKGIRNRILNINEFNNTVDYYFMLVKEYDEFFYLVDLNITPKCFILTPSSLEKYLEMINIYNSNITIEDLNFSSRTR